MGVLVFPLLFFAGGECWLVFGSWCYACLLFCCAVVGFYVTQVHCSFFFRCVFGVIHIFADFVIRYSFFDAFICGIFFYFRRDYIIGWRDGLGF